jgi:acyl-CoA thioesterase-1
MSNTRSRDPTRRHLAAGLVTLISTPAFAARPAVVTILGDSITAGYGLPASAALPAQLQLALTRSGVSAVVRGAGVSGDTTAGGLARANFSVQPDTSLCVVALGGNDLLQGLDPKATRANLDAIVRRLKTRGIGVVLAGIAAPPAIGRAYAAEFDAAFASVARAQHVAFYPDLLAGVGADTALKQRDGIHPNAAGAAVIARRLAPLVAKALRARS